MIALVAGMLLAACQPGAALPDEQTVVPASSSAQEATVSLVGELSDLDAQSARVGGVVVAVAADTQVQAGLKVDQLVQAEAVASDTGLRAIKIKSVDLAQAGQGFELTGIVESQSATAWVIGGQTVLIEAGTEINGAPVVGSLVKAEGRLGAAGQLIAREIEPAGDDEVDATPAPQNDEREFTGTLTAISGDLWTVGGTVVRVGVGTEIKDAIQPGDNVKVHASLGADGVLLAREVELADDVDDGDDRDDNGNDNAPGDDNGNDNGSDNANDNLGNDNRDDNGNDNQGNENGSNDNGGDDAGSNDNGDDHDHSGPGRGDDGDDDDHSGPGRGDDDDDDDHDDDHGGHGGDDDDDDHSGPGGGDDD